MDRYEAVRPIETDKKQICKGEVKLTLFKRLETIASTDRWYGFSRNSNQTLETKQTKQKH